MNLFMTGAGGYIGGSVAAKLIAEGHSIRGLVRTPEKARRIEQLGIEPVIGALDDSDLLMMEAGRADGVIDTASADHRPSVEAFIAALEHTDKMYLHTSGSSVIGDDVRGERASEAIFDENTAFVVAPSKQARRDIDLRILDAANKGVRSSVICPSNIYGIGRGVNPNSVQIPMLVSNAQVQGKVQIVGKGLNRWSNVHIDDLADLYLLVLARAPAGSFYFAENGENSFLELGSAIATRLGFGPLEHLSAHAAAEKWGERYAYYSLGSNSRVRATRARRELGWTPHGESMISWIQSDMPI